MKKIISTTIIIILIIVFLNLITKNSDDSNKKIVNKDSSEIKISDEWTAPVNLSNHINTDKWEDAPSISPDGKTLYFTIGEELNVDSFYSEWKKDKWSLPEPHNFNLKDFPDGAVHTQDNEILYFASVRPGTIGSGDIYTYKNNEVLNIGTPINTKDLESEPYISKDGNTLYFASNRNDGFGDADIWYSQKQGDGSWGNPINIGGPINTKIQETQPFITDDGQELYFTSSNRDGIGGPAIWKSNKNGTSWSKPELVVSGFVGEPTLTSDKSKLYFVHIFRKGSKLLDADIYVTEKK